MKSILSYEKDIEDLAVHIVAILRDQVTFVSEAVAVLVYELRQLIVQRNASDADVIKPVQLFRLCDAIMICINPYAQAGPYGVTPINHTIVVATEGDRVVDSQRRKPVRRVRTCEGLRRHVAEQVSRAGDLSVFRQRQPAVCGTFLCPGDLDGQSQGSESREKIVDRREM